VLCTPLSRIERSPLSYLTLSPSKSVRGKVYLHRRFACPSKPYYHRVPNSQTRHNSGGVGRLVRPPMLLVVHVQAKLPRYVSARINPVSSRMEIVAYRTELIEQGHNCCQKGPTDYSSKEAVSLQVDISRNISSYTSICE
jgi:hypothetical protein